MARIFQSGAELGDASLLQFSSHVGAQVSSVTKRSGSYSFYLTGDTMKVLVSAGAEFYIRFGFRPSSTGDSSAVSFYEGTTLHNKVEFDHASNVVSLYRGTTVVAISSPVITTNTWHLVEIHSFTNDTTGVLTCRIDGVEVVTFTGDTRNAGTTGNVDIISIYGPNTYIDDIAINDATDAKDNSWVGNGYCKALKVNGTISAQLVGQDADSVDNHLNVDDLPHDSDTTYNESLTVGERDVYSLEDITLAANEAINAVSIVAIAKLDSAGAGGIKVGGQTSGGTEVQSAAAALSSDNYKAVSELLGADPAAAAWSESNFNSLRATVEVA
jgi:hypothetical protein